MSEYIATIRWERGQQVFVDRKYSRMHTWKFDGGAEVVGSSSPHVVPLPMSDPRGVDPEEAFVASLSSCHMLFFLSFASARGFCADQYVDDAVGIMERDGANKMVMTRVVLRPRVTWSGNKVPSEEEIRAMHHQAHEECYIANSVKSEVVCEPALNG